VLKFLNIQVIIVFDKKKRGDSSPRFQFILAKP